MTKINIFLWCFCLNSLFFDHKMGLFRIKDWFDKIADIAEKLTEFKVSITNYIWVRYEWRPFSRLNSSNQFFGFFYCVRSPNFGEVLNFKHFCDGDHFSQLLWELLMHILFWINKFLFVPMYFPIFFRIFRY